MDRRKAVPPGRIGVRYAQRITAHIGSRGVRHATDDLAFYREVSRARRRRYSLELGNDRGVNNDDVPGRHAISTSCVTYRHNCLHRAAITAHGYVFTSLVCTSIYMYRISGAGRRRNISTHNACDVEQDMAMHADMSALCRVGRLASVRKQPST